MRNDFEQLLWLYSMGVENIPVRKPINYFEVQIKNSTNDSPIQDPNTSKKKEKTREPGSEKPSHETFKKEINEIENVNVLENYWCDTLINIFNIKKFWRLNKIDEQKKLNILIIHEPPTTSDFARYSFLDGKKRSLINNIVFAILSGESKKEVQNILCPILPIPLNNTKQFENIQSFHLNHEPGKQASLPHLGKTGFLQTWLESEPHHLLQAAYTQETQKQFPRHHLL